MYSVMHSLADQDPLYRYLVHAVYVTYPVIYSLADLEFRCTVQVHTVFWCVPYIIYDIPDLATTEPLPPGSSRSEIYIELTKPYHLPCW